MNKTTTTTKDPADLRDAVQSLCRMYNLDVPTLSVQKSGSKFVATLAFNTGEKFYGVDEDVARACDKTVEIAVYHFEENSFR